MTQSNVRNGTDDGIAPLSQRCRTTNGYPNDDAHSTNRRTSPGTTYRDDLSFSAWASPYDTPMSYEQYERGKQSERDEQSERSEPYKPYERDKQSERYEPATSLDRRGAR